MPISPDYEVLLRHDMDLLDRVVGAAGTARGRIESLLANKDVVDDVAAKDRILADQVTVLQAMDDFRLSSFAEAPPEPVGLPEPPVP